MKYESKYRAVLFVLMIEDCQAIFPEKSVDEIENMLDNHWHNDMPWPEHLHMLTDLRATHRLFANWSKKDSLNNIKLKSRYDLIKKEQHE